MSRPTINKEVLKAAFEAALSSNTNQLASPIQTARKRRPPDNFEMPPEKTMKTDAEKSTEDRSWEQWHSNTTKNECDSQANETHTSESVHETPTSSTVGNTTIVVHGDNNSQASPKKPTPRDDDGDRNSLEQEEEEASKRRHESDTMLAQAYRDLSEASIDMATWSHATSVALEEKLAAERRELEAASQMFRAQGRYEQAIERISQAVEHRHGREGM